MASPSGGSNVEIFGDAIYRKPTKTFYGVSQNEVLTFDMEIVSNNPVLGINRSKIEKWLFGRMSYCKLQIIQQDLQEIYFNCFLLNPQVTYVGNLCYGFTFTVECDAPWAWQIEKTYTFRNTSGQYIQNIKIYNDSDNTDYTYPYLEFKMKDIGGTFTIKNNSDKDRTLSITSLQGKEIVKIYNDYHTITSSTGELIGNKFNKVFFRLVDSMNYITISGDFEYVKIRYKNARKVGG